VAASRKPTEELDAVGGEVLHVPVDLMDRSAPAAVVREAVATFGRLDVLVNNAGGPPPGVTLPRTSFLDPDDDDWQAMFELNLFSAVRASRAALPHLLERGGAIVNVSSVHARLPVPMNPDYSTAKASMNALTKVLAEEFGPRGVRTNTVSPGPVLTNWWTKDGGAADVVAERLGLAPEQVVGEKAAELMALSTGRLADPREIADVVALLASPRSASTNGSEFVVDSGMLKTV
jgi:NAD(P)-dependent dehydrogenase (short-subunit alcohol dehydrogenase family)